MSNLLWYICLSVIGIGGSVYSIYKKRDIYKASTLVVFYLCMAGFAWTCEFIVLALFNSYAYKTGLFEDPWAQNLLGHLILNTTLYPAASVVMVAYSLRYTWIFIVTVSFTFLEYLFINLRLYEQHWWRYYMTVVAVIVFLSIANKWFKTMNQRRNGLTRAVTFYFVAIIIIHTPAPIILFFGKQYYQMRFINNWTGNIYQSTVIIIFFYHLIEVLLLIFCTCVLKKWYYNILPFIISPIVQNIFVKMNVLVIKDDWKLIYTLLAYEIFILLFVLIEKYTLKPKV